MASITENWYREFLFDFTAGFDSNTNPLLLQRNQLSYGGNTTVRQGFSKPRPPHRQIQLSFSGVTPANFLTSLFQGAGIYKDDYGNTYLMAQIGGRIFKVVVAGTSATVTEIPISSEAPPANGPTVPQIWMWQAEKWMIIDNGQSLPVFWDGQTARRSDGTVISLVTTLNADFSPSLIIGSISTATITPAYTGKFNIVVEARNALNGPTSYGLFQVISAGSASYAATFLNVNDSPGGTIVAGQQFFVASDPGTTRTLGVPNASAIAFAGGSLTIHITLSTAVPANVVGFSNGQKGTLFVKRTDIALIYQVQFTFQNISGNTFDAVCDSNPDSGHVLYLDVINPIATLSGTVLPPTVAYPIGIVTANATIPAVGATVDVLLDRIYSGAPAFACVYSGSNKNWQVTPKVGAAGTSLNLVNLSCTTALIPNGSIFQTVQELPSGRMGAYGLGRNWICLTDGRRFVASDGVGGPSGTGAYGFRDAVLRMTENAFIVGGGAFSVPSSGDEIKAMIFSTTLDASLGQGPLQVFTPTSVFSCIAPTIADRLSWATVTNPILTQSLIGTGALGQNSTIAENGDTIFRSLKGISSLVLARREFNTWGNVPISKEVDPIISTDDPALLPFSSGVSFDNRDLVTANPIQTSLGVAFQKLVALNFDPISSLRGKAPSVYDGVWTDLNILQIMKGQFSGIERCYAFCLDQSLSQLQLYEIMPSATTITDDDGFAIYWDIQSCSLFNKDTNPTKRQYLQLQNGEIYVDNLVGTVIFQAFYKPDQYPNWVPWVTWQETQNPTTSPSFRPRMGLGTPSVKACDPSTGRVLPTGYTFQFRLQVIGQCTFKGAQFMASPVPEPAWLTPNCVAVTFPPLPPLPPPVPAAPGVFTSTTPILIRNSAGPGPTGSPYPGTVVVSTGLGGLTTISVQIYGLTHSRPQDVKLVLVGPAQPLAPSGSAVWLLVNSGGATACADVNLTYVMDNAPKITSLPLQTGTYTGCLNPGFTSGIPAITQPVAGSILEYRGQIPDGTWSLYAYTSGPAGSSGIIAGGWSLTIT